MDSVLTIALREGLALLLVTAGVAIFLRGSRAEMRGWRMGPRAPTRTVTFVRGLRLAILGLSIFALGIAWEWQITWLGVLALIFAAEEMFETTLVIYGLTGGKDLRLRP